MATVSRQERGIRTGGRLGAQSVLLIGTLAVATVTLLVLPARSLPMEPALLALMKFMAALKGATALAGLGLAWWRLGYPASPNVVSAYLLGPWGLTAASVAIWQLQHVVPSMVLFYGSLAVLVWAALTDSWRRAASRAAT